MGGAIGTWYLGATYPDHFAANSALLHGIRNLLLYRGGRPKEWRTNAGKNPHYGIYTKNVRTHAVEMVPTAVEKHL